jgi:hypothetical protein
VSGQGATAAPTTSNAELASRLLTPHAPTAFDGSETAGLAEPVRRWFAKVIEPGTTTPGVAIVHMRGQIRIGRWLPFAATEVLDPHRGFLWSARVAGGFITGFDRYFDRAARMEWKVLGIAPIVRAAGADVARSSVGRMVGEAIWVPPAMLPTHQVAWLASDESTLADSLAVADEDLEVVYRLGTDGHVRSVRLDRWGDPDRSGTYRSHPFGGELSGHRRFAGITVPTAGRIGWHYGTDRWSEGEFFRFQITDVRLPKSRNPRTPMFSAVPHPS